MDKIADGRRRLVADDEDANLIAHAGIAQPTDPQTSIHHRRETDGFEELTMGFDRKSNRCAAAVVQSAPLHQIAIDDGIEKFVIDDVVDMMINVIVAPARRDLAAALIMFAALLFWVSVRHFISASTALGRLAFIGRTRNRQAHRIASHIHQFAPNPHKLPARDKLKPIALVIASLQFDAVAKRPESGDGIVG